MKRPDVVLVDANVIIEAVRTGCWPAICGQLAVETVEECREEVRRGSAETIPGYVPVHSDDLAKLGHVRTVDETMRARLKLAYPDADGLDAGEHDLVAYVLGSPSQGWVMCSPDKAFVRAAVKLGFGDTLCSLEELADLVGSRPRPELRRQFTSEWLRSFRTRVILDLP